MKKTYTKAAIEKAREERVRDRNEQLAAQDIRAFREVFLDEVKQNKQRLAAFEKFMDRSYIIGRDWRNEENIPRVSDLKDAFTAGWRAKGDDK